MTRTITIIQSGEFLGDTAKVPSKIIDSAVGYLSGWAMSGGSFPTVIIYQERDGNMTAVYHKAGNLTDAGYVIGAILRGDSEVGYEYSFHS